MAFPTVERVLYQINPLEEVNCQLRFPPILAIDVSAPAAFQEAVRDDFPYYELKSSVKLPPGVPQNLSNLVERDLALVGHKSHVFGSSDRCWALTLTRDGLKLASKRYDRWERFRTRLQKALDALVASYRPSFFLHTCVRYKNAIRRSPLGLAGRSWADLIQPYVCGPLDPLEVSDAVESVQTRFVLRLPDGLGRVDANCGLGVHQPSGESAFLIESHIYHEEQKASSDVLLRLDALNQQARCFFRWCITDELHRAMRPTSVTVP